MIRMPSIGEDTKNMANIVFIRYLCRLGFPIGGVVRFHMGSFINFYLLIFTQQK